MVASPWIIRPAYGPDRLGLAAGNDAPRAVAVSPAHPTDIFVAPSVAGTPAVFKVSTASDPFAVTVTSPALTGEVAAMVPMDNLATPSLMVATDETPARIYKLRQDTLAVVVASIALSAGEGPVTRMAYDGTTVFALIGSSPGRIVAIDPAGAGAPIRSHAVTLGAGQNTPRGLAVDSVTQRVWAGASNGVVSRYLNNPGGPSLTLQTTITLPETNASALAFAPAQQLLYAGAGPHPTTGEARLYQVNPFLTPMTVRATVGYPMTYPDSPFTHMALDTTGLRANQYLYALVAGSPGALYQFDTGLHTDITVPSQVGGVRLARRYNMDSNYNVSVDSQLVIAPTTSMLGNDYLYFSQYVAPGILVRFDASYIGLVLKPSWGWDPKRGVRQVLYRPVGAENEVVRSFGVRGRTYPMNHFVDVKTDFDAQYLQYSDDEKTLLRASEVFCYVRDFAPTAYAVTRKAVIQDIGGPWPNAPLDLVPELRFQILERA